MKNGARLDGWDEYFNYSCWFDALNTCGIDADFYTTRGYDEDEVLPWDIIDCGVTKAFHKRERERAYEAATTPNCREKCSGCGANKLGGERACCPRAKS